MDTQWYLGTWLLWNSSNLVIDAFWFEKFVSVLVFWYSMHKARTCHCQLPCDSLPFLVKTKGDMLVIRFLWYMSFLVLSCHLEAITDEYWDTTVFWYIQYFSIWIVWICIVTDYDICISLFFILLYFFQKSNQTSTKLPKLNLNIYCRSAIWINKWKCFIAFFS